MELPKDELVEEACRVIEAGYRHLQRGASGRVADLVTITQGYLRLLSEQPTATYESKLRDAVLSLRVALGKAQ
jgi:hypothetical protein